MMASTDGGTTEDDGGPTEEFAEPPPEEELPPEEEPLVPDEHFAEPPPDQTCPDGSVIPADQACPPPPDQTCPDGSVIPADQACPPPPEEQLPCPDGSVVSVNEACPLTDKPLPECDGSLQDCVTPDGFVCPAGSAAHECELPQPEEQLQTCQDGSTVTGDKKCPSAPAQVDCKANPDNSLCNSEAGRDGLPFCDLQHDHTGSCYDRLDEPKQYCAKYGKDDADFCKVYGCSDLPFYMICKKDKDKDKDKTKVIHKTTVIQSSSASASASATANANAIAAEVSHCKLDGNTNGIQQKFDTARYQVCGFYANGPKAYSDGFVVGCIQVGNTQQLCQAFVDSSILNTKTQPTQLPTQTTTQAPQTQTQSATEPTQPQTRAATPPTQPIQPTQ
jgi:hypothetical protein